MTSVLKEDIKSNLHPNNRHRGRYDFTALISSEPDLRPFVSKNQYGNLSIDFFDPDAVKVLNRALLIHHYGIKYWDIPEGYLCPPIPGRSEYIHRIAELLAVGNPSRSRNRIPTGPHIKCLDVGVGANCIYPIIGCTEYGWSFIGSDIDPIAVENSQKIIVRNSILKGKIEIRLQHNKTKYFKDILHKDEIVDCVICNPPFHSSKREARSVSQRKLRHLKHQVKDSQTLNFGGQSHELWCKGGELEFVQSMIKESREHATSCYWFSSLISKESHLRSIYQQIKKVEAKDVKTINMSNGNKKARVVAWTFLDSKQKQKWMEYRWQSKKR